MRRFVVYTAVGAVATLCHYAVLAAGVELAGWPAWVASGVGAGVGAQVGFLGNRWLTFAHRGPAAVSWLRFQGTAALGAVLGMAIVALGVRAGWHYLAAQAVATMAVLVATFWVNRRWTFG